MRIAGWLMKVKSFGVGFLGVLLRVNSHENVTEGRQFTHMKMLLKPTASFLDLSKSWGSHPQRRDSQRLRCAPVPPPHFFGSALSGQQSPATARRLQSRRVPFQGALTGGKGCGRLANPESAAEQADSSRETSDAASCGSGIADTFSVPDRRQALIDFLA